MNSTRIFSIAWILFFVIDVATCQEDTIQGPQKLSERIKCDNNNNESDRACIHKLQVMLQEFINVNPNLRYKDRNETLGDYERRVGYLITGAKQDTKHFNDLYNRCKSGIVRTESEKKLAGDYAKVRQELLICEQETAKTNLKNGQKRLLDEEKFIQECVNKTINYHQNFALYQELSKEQDDNQKLAEENRKLKDEVSELKKTLTMQNNKLESKKTPVYLGDKKDKSKRISKLSLNDFEFDNSNEALELFVKEVDEGFEIQRLGSKGYTTLVINNTVSEYTVEFLSGSDEGYYWVTLDQKY